MKIKPNETIVDAHVREIRPAADGWGADVDLDVVENQSSAAHDFLQTKRGALVTAFTAEPDRLHVGDRVRATLALNAGPSGSRVVLRASEPKA